MTKRLHGALINARYSTDNQNPDSIEVQVAKCTEWCHAHSIPVLGVYADEATSGMKDTRPRYAAMMRDLQDGVGDMVVIYDQSRLFRKMTSWFAFWRTQKPDARLGIWFFDTSGVARKGGGRDGESSYNIFLYGK